jgi:hypothetical protein
LVASRPISPAESVVYFLSCPLVCPEPVLVKRSFLV